MLFADNKFNIIADEISISDDSNKIIAKGNVQIFSGEKKLIARKVVYNNLSDLVKVYGPITITDDKGITINADYSEVTKDLKNHISTGVKALFEDYFKITSEEIKYISEDQTQFKNSTGTSCKVCEKDNSKPIWNINSKTILHDSTNKNLIFKDATLEIGGIPVFYTPYLKTPEPGIKRASGFLTPSIISSDIMGFGIKQPYFLVLNQYSDLTISLFKTNQTTLYETEYRANFLDEKVKISSIIEPQIFSKKINGYINVIGEKKYPEDYKLEYNFTIFDKKKSLTNYDHEITDFISNKVSIKKYQKNKVSSFNTFYLQNLRTSEIEDPIIFPYYSEKTINKIFNNNIIISNELGILNLFHKKKIHTRIDHKTEIGFNKFYKNGIILENLASISNLLYNTREKNNVEKGHFEIRPLLSSTISFPLIKNNKIKSKEILTPKIQVNFSPSNTDTPIQNYDSTEMNLSEKNLFAINRFSGKDNQEKGFWINSGIKYENLTLSGTNFGTELGQVFRVNNTDQFSNSSGLNGKNSDFLISSFLDYKNIFIIKNSSLITNNLDFRKSETSMLFSGEKNEVASSLIYQSKSENNTDNKNLTELSFSLLSKIDKNWKSTFDLKHDIISKKTISASAGFTFENECVDFSLNLSKRFTGSEKIPEDTRIELSFDLGGFGKRVNSNQICSMM